MDNLTKSSRVNSALKVQQHTYDGMTVSKACEEVGLPRSSYYYIVKNNPEAFIEAQEFIRYKTIEQLGMIMLSKVGILEKLIEAGLNEDTSPSERLAILKELDRQMDNLKASIPQGAQHSQASNNFPLTGPTTAKQKSRTHIH